MNTISIKSCVLALAAAASLSASADLLYWTVSNPTESWTNPGENTPISFAYATVSADGVGLHAYNQEGITELDALSVSDADPGTGLGTRTDAAYFGSFNYSSASTFYVELWNADGDRVGWQSYSAAQVADSIWKEGEGGKAGGSGVSVFTVSQVVPEPTSGLLLALGGALLALRRRRAA